MGPQVFAAISVLYVLVLVAGVVAWRWDREQQNKVVAKALEDSAELAEKLKFQLREKTRKLNTANHRLREETEARRTLEGSVVIEDMVSLDPSWHEDMAWAAEALAANDPSHGA